jgi:hypothetical protein
MSKASHSASKKRMKEFAQLDKTRSLTPGQKGSMAGKAGSAGAAAPRLKTAPTNQRKTGV